MRVRRRIYSFGLGGTDTDIWIDREIETVRPMDNKRNIDRQTDRQMDKQRNRDSKTDGCTKKAGLIAHHFPFPLRKISQSRFRNRCSSNT